MEDTGEGEGVGCRLTVLAKNETADVLLLPCGRGVGVVQAKLAVAPLSKWGGCVIGLYEEGSHRVAPMPRESVRQAHHTNCHPFLAEQTCMGETEVCIEDACR